MKKLHQAFLSGLTLLCLLSPAQADLYFEASAESGGETFASTSDGIDLNIAGGLKLAIGLQNYLNDLNDDSVSISVGYLFDSLEAPNGEAEFDTMTIDALYHQAYGQHRFSIGMTYHLDPVYKDKINGRTVAIDFDSTLGGIFQYSRKLSALTSIGIRLTKMDYAINRLKVEADSIGIFISNEF
jgi:hypothetical protein